MGATKKLVLELTAEKYERLSQQERSEYYNYYYQQNPRYVDEEVVKIFEKFNTVKSHVES